MNAKAKSVLLRQAKRYVWWKTPKEAFGTTGRWLTAEIMNKTNPEDRAELERVLSVEFLRECLKQCHACFYALTADRFKAGDPLPSDSWEYWHRRLGLIGPNEPAPFWHPRPELKRLLDAEAEERRRAGEPSIDSLLFAKPSRRSKTCPSEKAKPRNAAKQRGKGIKTIMAKNFETLRTKMPPEARTRTRELARKGLEEIDRQQPNKTVTEGFIRSLRGSTKGVGDERERSHRDDEER